MTTAVSPANILDLAQTGFAFEGEGQRLRARLDLFEEAVVLTRYRQSDGTVEVCHEVSPDDLAAALADVELSTGLLPPGCLFYRRVGGVAHLGLYRAPGQARPVVVRSDQRREYHVPLPGLVFVGHDTTYQVFAVAKRPTGPYDSLYRAPFPNVHLGGQICPGTVPFPACAPDTIARAAALFLGSEFNGDLALGKSKKHPANVLALWAEIEGQRRYPGTDLQPAGHLQDLLCPSNCSNR